MKKYAEFNMLKNVTHDFFFVVCINASINGNQSSDIKGNSWVLMWPIQGCAAEQGAVFKSLSLKQGIQL